jgi:hypothetical protein
MTKTNSEPNLELTLLLRVKTARDVYKKADDARKYAGEELDASEGKLVEFMTDRDIKSTAKYEGIGFASLDKPELFARVNVPDQEKLFTLLNSVGRMDLIKSTVHHKSLSSFVKEMLEQGQSIPEFIQYGFKSTLKVYKV